MVVGTGGYVSGPVLLVATFFGIKTLIQEQNSYPGITTRFLAKRVDQVHIAFQDAQAHLRGAKRVRLSGNPVRDIFVHDSTFNARQQLELKDEPATLLVYGGSQGAHIINMALRDCLPDLMEKSDLQIIWSTGKKDFPEFLKSCAQWSDRIKIFPFIEKMDLAYGAADFCLSRSGALTLAELAIAGLGSILIPYRYATGGHQEANARSFEKNKAAVVITEQKLTPKRLLKEIISMGDNPKLCQNRGSAAHEMSFPQARQDIALAILEMVNIDSGE